MTAAAYPQSVPSTSPTPGDLVILRESELDCDVATAIQRIRSKDATSRSRILVVAPESRVAGEEVEEGLSGGSWLGEKHGERRALEPLGKRLLTLITCLDRFFEETRWALTELEESVPEETRVRLLHQVKVLQEIQEWSQAVAVDLRDEARLAAEGYQPIDTHALWREVATTVEARTPGLRIAIEPLERNTICWARSAELAEAFGLALTLAGKRIGDRGAVTVRTHFAPGRVQHRVTGAGEPQAIQATALIERFRRLVVEVHGGQLLPDEFGAHGTGILIELPTSR